MNKTIKKQKKEAIIEQNKLYLDNYTKQMEKVLKVIAWVILILFVILLIAGRIK